MPNFCCSPKVQGAVCDSFAVCDRLDVCDGLDALISPARIRRGRREVPSFNRCQTDLNSTSTHGGQGAEKKLSGREEEMQIKR